MIVQILIQAMKADGPIAAAFGDRVYPKNLPDAPTYPNIVVSKISGGPEYDMAGRANIERDRVQVDIRTDGQNGSGYEAMVTLKDLVRNFIDQRPPPGPPCTIDNARCITDIDSPAGDPESATERSGPRVRRRILEFVVWVKT